MACDWLQVAMLRVHSVIEKSTVLVLATCCNIPASSYLHSPVNRSGLLAQAAIACDSDLIPDRTDRVTGSGRLRYHQIEHTQEREECRYAEREPGNETPA